MKILSAILFLFIGQAISTFAQVGVLPIIPKPRSVTQTADRFTFDRKTRIFADSAAGKRSAEILNETLFLQYGFRLRTAAKMPEKNAIVFTEPTKMAGKVGSYSLNIDAAKIAIQAFEAGQFYAIQTLRQLLPLTLKQSAPINGVQIADEPNFSYRGLHLDVSRHFMPKEFVKKYIDLMSQYKLNYFHWHLTDDQGWRIEIKKYPKLTALGSKRAESHSGRFTPIFKGDGVPVEGFYTQSDIKEIVEFAKKRQVTIVPEIELPGHSSAALAAYPEFGCKENYEYKVQQTWGIFKEVFCPTEKTFKFLEDVLDETIALFPDSPYIHIGGDEVLKDHWKESAFVQELMKRENLKDEHEVQSYFIRRIEKFVNSRGKTIIGWDEILEGGLAPNAVVMSWRGEKGGVDAARTKHNVIMTPGNSLYFDYGQGDPMYEPLNIGNHLPIETVYSYNPVPKELSEAETKFILGAQANVWTEYLQTPKEVEYMVFPRVLALAEVVWTLPEHKNFAEFSQRMTQNFQLLDAQDVNYRIPPPIGLQNQVFNNQTSVRVELLPSVPGAEIYYTTDGRAPDEQSNRYEKPFNLDLKRSQSIELKTVVITANKRKSAIYSAVFWHGEMQKPTELPTMRSGVNVKLFNGNFSGFNEIETLKPSETFESKSIQTPQFQAKTDNFSSPFGVVFDGFIYIPQDEIYAFEVETNGKTFLKIDGNEIVNEKTERHLYSSTGIAPLKKGYHLVNFGFLHAGSLPLLNLRWGIKGTGLRRIYGSELFLKQ